MLACRTWAVHATCISHISLTRFVLKGFTARCVYVQCVHVHPESTHVGINLYLCYPLCVTDSFPFYSSLIV